MPPVIHILELLSTETITNRIKYRAYFDEKKATLFRLPTRIYVIKAIKEETRTNLYGISSGNTDPG